MPEWKKSIFINTIKARVQLESRTPENILQEYTKLTKAEKRKF